MWYNEEDDEADFFEEETFFVASSPEASCTMNESSGCLSSSSSSSSSATTSPLSFGPTGYEMAQKSIAALGYYDDASAGRAGTTTTTFDLPRNLYLAAPGLIGMGAPTCADHIRNLHALFNVRSRSTRRTTTEQLPGLGGSSERFSLITHPRPAPRARLRSGW